MLPCLFERVCRRCASLHGAKDVCARFEAEAEFILLMSQQAGLDLAVAHFNSFHSQLVPIRREGLS